MQTGLATVQRLEAALGLSRRLLTTGRPEDLDEVQAVLVDTHAALDALAAQQPDAEVGRVPLAEALARLADTLRKLERVNAAGLTAVRDLLAAGGHAAGYDVRARSTAPGRGVTMQARG
jgi:hypothetical protein